MMRYPGTPPRVLSAMAELPAEFTSEPGSPLSRSSRASLASDASAGTLPLLTPGASDARDSGLGPSLLDWSPSIEGIAQDGTDRGASDLGSPLPSVEVPGEPVTTGPEAGDPALRRAVSDALVMVWLFRSAQVGTAGAFARELPTPQLSAPRAVPSVAVPPTAELSQPSPPQTVVPTDTVAPESTVVRELGEPVPAPVAVPAEADSAVSRTRRDEPLRAETAHPTLTSTGGGSSLALQAAWQSSIDSAPGSPLAAPEGPAGLGGISTSARPEGATEEDDYPELRRVALAAVAMLWLVRSGRANVVGASPEPSGPTAASSVGASAQVRAPEAISSAPRATVPSPPAAFVAPPADRPDTRTVLGLLARDWLLDSSVAGGLGGLTPAHGPTTPSTPANGPTRPEARLPLGDDHPVGGIAALLLAAPEWAAPPPAAAAPAPLAAKPVRAVAASARPPAPTPSDRPPRPRRSRCYQGNTFGFS